MNGTLEVGLFLLLPSPEGVAEEAVIDEALWQAEAAEAAGLDSVWIAEHHLSRFGLVGAPSVLAAAISQRTKRIGIGYGVAVVPLYHPVRLAEEIAWVDQLSRGRVMVGLGAGLSARELGAFGVAMEERHERLEEGAAVLRALLGGREGEGADGCDGKGGEGADDGALGAASGQGRPSSLPAVELHPRPYRGRMPLLLRATSGGASLAAAAARGEPVLLGTAPVEQIADRLAAYRAAAAAAGQRDSAARRMRDEAARKGRPLDVAAQVAAERDDVARADRLVAEIRVLRRIVVAPTDAEAAAEARRALVWEETTACGIQDSHDTAAGTGHSSGAVSEAVEAAMAGCCCGSPATVRRQLAALRDAGVRHVIAWLSFGDMPAAAARRTFALLSTEVLPGL